MIVTLKTLRLDELDVTPLVRADIEATRRSDVSHSLSLNSPDDSQARQRRRGVD